jgi:PAS domain S-box-containing protein
MNGRMKAIKTSTKSKSKNTSTSKQINRTPKISERISVSQDKHGKKIKTRNREGWLQKSKQLFHLNPASIALISLPEKKFIDVNEASLRIFCFSREEVIGKTIDELNIFVQPGKSRKAEDQLIKHGYIDNNELKFRRKDGTILDGIVSGEIIEHQGEKCFLIIMTDITSRKRSEKVLRESEEKYRTIMESTEEGYYEIDLAGNFTFFNDSLCKILGYSRKELLGMNNRNYTDQETSKKVFQAFNKVYRTGESTKEFDWQIIRKDGAKRYIEQSASLQKDSSGKPTGFRGIIHDITERKKTEELLKKSEEKYRLLADHVRDQVWLMDMNLNITYISPSTEKSFGYTLEELKKTPLNKLLNQKSYREVIDISTKELPKALAASPKYSLKQLFELEFICKNGHPLWIECAFSFIRDDNGKPLSILGEGRNITERKLIENSLRKSEENFRHSLDNSPLGVRISTLKGETIYANKAILNIYGYDSIDELKNTPLAKRYTPQSHAEFQIRKEKRLRGEFGPSEYEINIVRKNGEVRHVYVFRKEIFWNGKKQSQVIYQDITERRKAEEKLKETMESLRRSIRTTIQVLGIASEARDPYMAGHQRRVADIARAIATEMNLPSEIIEVIRMTGAIHDIGKISIPSEILCKPAVLTDLEFSLIKAHSQYSYDIMKDVESPWPLANIVYQHHERMDGSGYPQGLKGENILIEARILAIADVVEAMMSYRPYRPSLGLDIALAEIENNAGLLYDRKATNACLKLFREKGFRLE